MILRNEFYAGRCLDCRTWKWYNWFVFCGDLQKSKSNSNIFSLSSGKKIDKYHIKNKTPHVTHLNMKMNNIRSEKNIATLSIVLSMTNNWRRRFGINRTSLRIRSNRNVRSTDNPELPLDPPSPPTQTWHNSTALETEAEKNEEENLC